MDRRAHHIRGRPAKRDGLVAQCLPCRRIDHRDRRGDDQGRGLADRRRRARRHAAKTLPHRLSAVVERLAGGEPLADRLDDLALREFAVIDVVVGFDLGQIDDLHMGFLEDGAIGFDIRIDGAETRFVAREPP